MVIRLMTCHTHTATRPGCAQAELNAAVAAFLPHAPGAADEDVIELLQRAGRDGTGLASLLRAAGDSAGRLFGALHCTPRLPPSLLCSSPYPTPATPRSSPPPPALSPTPGSVLRLRMLSDMAVANKVCARSIAGVAADVLAVVDSAARRGCALDGDLLDALTSVCDDASALVDGLSQPGVRTLNMCSDTFISKGFESDWGILNPLHSTTASVPWLPRSATRTTTAAAPHVL